MSEEQIFEQVVKILTPYVKDEKALASISGETNILEDLKVNSARLVDVVLAFEDEFDIEIADEDVDSVNTVGDCVSLIARTKGYFSLGLRVAINVGSHRAMAPKDPVSINQSFMDSTVCAGNDLHFPVEDRGSKKLSSGVFSVKEGICACSYLCQPSN